MDFVDQSLARRLESAEEMPQVHYAKLYQKLCPEIGAAVEPICGGHMIFAGVGSPIGRTTGMGFDGSATATDLDRMEEFYRAHKAPSQIDVCPLTDPSLLELLKPRRYEMGELNNVLFRKLDGVDAGMAPAGATIRQGQAQRAEEFADIVVRSFFPDGDAPEGFTAMISPIYQIDGAILFVAEIDGKPVACGAGLIIPEHRILALFGAGTLPEFRRRGLQTALLRKRMAVAAKAGCEYAVIVTRGGTTSQHNAERLGFRVAYSKATLVKELRD
ncbi:MAG: GNAT family N-acetyltransferase [Acidobacteriia bacterium]|nr:GNAT family N-acetyltransferase [Terriglobia bacterium]